MTAHSMNYRVVQTDFARVQYTLKRILPARSARAPSTWEHDRLPLSSMLVKARVVELQLAIMMN